MTLVTHSIIFEILNRLVLYGIQGDFLLKIKYVIAWLLFLIFYNFMDSGMFPTALKMGSITPILKSGDPRIVSYYCPFTFFLISQKFLKLSFLTPFGTPTIIFSYTNNMVSVRVIQIRLVIQFLPLLFSTPFMNIAK